MSWQVKGAPHPPFGWSEPPRTVVLEDGYGCHEPLVYVPMTEVYELRELVRDLIEGPLLYSVYHGDEDLTLSEGIEWAEADMRRRARELGVEFFGAEVGA